MVNLIDLVAELFGAYGREATEEQLRSYVSVLKHQPNAYIAKAVVDATSGGFDRLPTTSELIRLAREIEQVEGKQGERNKVRHQELANDYYRKAIKAGWSLAMRDELMEVLDAAINRKTGMWRLSEQQLHKEVSELVYAVNDYRRRCKTAEDRNEPLPSEKQERWGWSIEEHSGGWDPAKESLWDHIKRLF